MEHRPDLEQPDVALAALGVVEQRLQQSRGHGRTQEPFGLDQGIGDLDIRRGEARGQLVGLGHERRRPCLARPQSAQHVLQASPLTLTIGEPARLGPRRRAAGQAGVSEGAGDLFGQVGLTHGQRAYVGPERRDDHGDRVVVAPGRRGLEAEGGEQTGDRRCRQRRAEEAVHPRWTHGHLKRPGHVTGHVEDALGQRQARAGRERQQIAEALGGPVDAGRVAPLSNRADASVLRLSRLAVRAMAMGTK